MEVHHHAHTERKKWTHYLWEFLMLFLAVFCGFLAEYKLEHTIEHQREKQFVKQLLADLRADSGYFAKRTIRVNKILEKHQHFYELMTRTTKPSDKEIILGSLPLLYTFDVSATTGAYNQMKASGSLRYIRNEALTNSIQRYYEVLLPRVIKYSDDEIVFFNNNIFPFIQKHFRMQDFDSITDSLKTDSPVMMNRTGQTDQELLNVMESYSQSHRVIQDILVSPTMKKLNELIDLLKEEYHLK